MTNVITDWVRIKDNLLCKNAGVVISTQDNGDDIYRQLQYSYPKFFKMDKLCKWAWLGVECLVAGNGTTLYEGLDKSRVAVVLMTSHGCLDVDKKYHETVSTIPSPALFVYTLSNIMLGEICIRHGFKGEQTCFINNTFNAEDLKFWVDDLLSRDMDACLCGWINVTGNKSDVCLFWVTKHNGKINFSPDAIEQVYNS